MTRPNPHIALIYHYDLARALDGEPTDWVAIPVNVDAGREGGDLCRAAADFAKRRDLFAMPAPTVAAPCSVDVAGEQPVAEPEPVAPARSAAQVSATKGRTETVCPKCNGDGVAFLDDDLQARACAWCDNTGWVPVAAVTDDLTTTRDGADFAIRRDLFAMPAPTNGEPCSGTTSNRLAPSSHAPTQTAAGNTSTSCDLPNTGSSSTPPAMSSDATPRKQSPNSAAERNQLRDRIAGLIDAGHEQIIRRHWPPDVVPLSKPGHTDDELAQILAAVRRVETEVGAAWHPDDGPPPHSRLAIERALKAWEGRDPGTAWFAASLIATFEQCRNADSTFEELVAQFTIEQANRLYESATNQ